MNYAHRGYINNSFVIYGLSGGFEVIIDPPKTTYTSCIGVQKIGSFCMNMNQLIRHKKWKDIQSTNSAPSQIDKIVRSKIPGTSDYVLRNKNKKYIVHRPYNNGSTSMCQRERKRRHRFPKQLTAETASEQNELYLTHERRSFLSRWNNAELESSRKRTVSTDNS